MTSAEQLVATCRHLAALGLSPGGSGNVSVRVDDRIIVTPTGSALSRVTESDLAMLDAHGNVLSSARPSKEYPLHLAAYRARPDARAIVHLHSVHAVAVSCQTGSAGSSADSPLPVLTPYQVTRLGPLPVAPYAKPGSAELADAVGALMAEHHAALMAHHGSVVAARDLHLAADLAEELESTAQLSLLVRGTAFRELDPRDVAELRTAQ